jgi:hypothetical protein
MKAYLYRYNEILIISSYPHEERQVDAYNELFEKLLLSKSIGDKKIFQSFNLLNSKITSTPQIVRALLQKEKLPAFKFLICKN